MRRESQPLAGRHVLVVEDEFLIADDLARTLQQLGAEVVGPTGTLSGARRLLSGGAVDCAVLDINLEGEMAFPLAEELERRSVPVIVASGYGSNTLADKVHAAAILEKPCSPERIADVLTAAIAERSER